MKKTKVFISYAREDSSTAEQLYSDLLKAGLEPWLDNRVLQPGQKWKPTIRKAIRNSDYFIALLSAQSVSKRGHIQKETRAALDVLEEFTDEDIFFIPARIDDCTPVYETIRELTWVDLFPSYTEGLQKILKVLNACPQIQETHHEKPDQTIKSSESSSLEETVAFQENLASAGFATASGAAGIIGGSLGFLAGGPIGSAIGGFVGGVAIPSAALILFTQEND